MFGRKKWRGWEEILTGKEDGVERKVWQKG
jgi:hypothetical protein